MTREEAIENLKGLLESNYVDSFEDAENEALKMAIKALEHPEQNVIAVVPCGDCISRQAVLKLFATHDGKYLFEAIRDLPSVTPKQNGWILVSEKLPEEREWYLAVFKEKDTGYQLIPRVADYIGNGENKWRIIDEEGLCQEYRDILECIAWMPLPAQFEPQESEGA